MKEIEREMMMLFNKLFKNNKIAKRVLALAAAAVMLASPFGGQATSVNATSTASTYGLTDKIEDGTILHAWCWSFNTIKNNMADIAKAGYTSIQTSPINTVKVGNGGDLRFTEQWYYHYQPTDYKIGNYQLGSESEFKAMCDEADKYGINIIVDVVANHCSSDYNAISSNIKNIPNAFHYNGKITDADYNEGNRWAITQKSLLDLIDNNTANTQLQNYIKQFLVRSVQLGADGFRYDAAKHIELPDENGCGSNFWPNVLSNGAKFQYGEVLQDKYSREGAYAQYMSVTASTYGKKIRDLIGQNNVSASSVMGYDINVAKNKMVTWVESHDNYANKLSDYGSSQWMNDEQLKLAWAVVAARGDGTPLFFSRPVGGGGNSWDCRFPEVTKVGDRGSDLFKDDEVAAVNFFRNAMVGEGEYLRNPNGDSRVLMIERGTKGVVIVNMTGGDYQLSSATKLANGTYTNQTDNKNQFTVSNGTISGKLPGRSVVVLYDKQNIIEDDKTDITISFEKPSTWGNNINAYIYDESGSSVKMLKEWPGQAMTANADGVYTLTYGNTFTNPLVIFNDGTNQSPGAKLKGFAVVNDAYYNINGSVSRPAAPSAPTAQEVTETTIVLNPIAGAEYKMAGGNWQTSNSFTGLTAKTDYTFYARYAKTGSALASESSAAAVIRTSEGEITENQVTIYYKTNNATANIHYKVGTGSWTTAPGVAMSNSDISGYKVITLDMGSATTLTACFNDGNNNWDNNNTNNYTFNGINTYTVADGKISTGAPQSVDSKNITVYYYTGWSNPNMHYQIGSGNWTAVPGVAMSNSDKGGYKVITVNMGSETRLTACFNDGNNNWDNNNSQNYYFGSLGTYTVKDGNISQGAPN